MFEGIVLHQPKALGDIPASAVLLCDFDHHCMQTKIIKGVVDQSAEALDHNALSLVIGRYPIADGRQLIISVNFMEPNDADNGALVRDPKGKGTSLLIFCCRALNELKRIGCALLPVNPRQPSSQVCSIVVYDRVQGVGIVLGELAEKGVFVNSKSLIRNLLTLYTRVV